MRVKIQNFCEIWISRYSSKHFHIREHFRKNHLTLSVCAIFFATVILKFSKASSFLELPRTFALVVCKNKYSCEIFSCHQNIFTEIAPFSQIITCCQLVFLFLYELREKSTLNNISENSPFFPPIFSRKCET
jgi:hypothetical protein